MADSVLVAQAVRKAGWRLLPLLAIGYLISYIDRANVGFAALTMNHELGLSATQFGFAAGMFYVGYCLLELPSNLALRRFGARRWLARIMVTWGIAAAGAVALLNSIGNLGGFVGPYMVGWLKDRTGSFNAGIYGLVSMVALAGVIALALPWVERGRRASA